MRLTNKLGLPASYVRAMERHEYKGGGDVSVTGLIGPPRIRVLLKRHEDKLEEDVSDWPVQSRYMGSAIHEDLLHGAGPGDIVKKRFSIKRLGWEISGEPDLFETSTGKLTDWKTPSVWGIVFGDSVKEFDQQLNLYAMILRENQIVVKEAEAAILLKDWRKREARGNLDYPQTGVVIHKVKLWAQDHQESFLEERLRLHQRAEAATDDELEMCSPAERWEKPAVWAVMKPGNKKSSANFTIPKHGPDAEAQASQMAERTGSTVQYRPGESTRCVAYCPVRNICPRGLSEQAKAGGEME